MCFISTGLRRLALPLCALMTLAMPAKATCSAFPVLFAIIGQVEALQRANNDTTAMATALKIEGLRTTLTTNGLQTRLLEIGLGRHFGELSAFKVRLGALTKLARTGGRDALRPFLFGSGFQQNLQRSREIVALACEDQASTNPSRAAWREISLPRGTARARPFSFVVASGFGIIICMIAALAGITAFRMRKERRERRIAKRVACRIPTRISIHKTRYDIQMVDLSRGGANLSCPLALPVGQRMTLTFAGITCDATVMWSNDKFAGIKFDHALSQAQQSDALAHNQPALPFRNEKRGTRLDTA